MHRLQYIVSKLPIHQRNAITLDSHLLVTLKEHLLPYSLQLLIFFIKLALQVVNLFCVTSLEHLHIFACEFELVYKLPVLVLQ